MRSDPVFVASSSDTDNVRWVTRTAGGSGFLFANNYERLANMSAKTHVRFNLTWANASFPDLVIPAASSAPLTLAPDSWFVWPIRQPLRRQGTASLAWATAQPLARIESPKSTVVVLSETPGIPVELGVALDGGHIVAAAGATVTHTVGLSVVTGITPGTAAVAIVTEADGHSTSVVVLPAAAADRAFTTELAGTKTLVLTAPEVLMAAGVDDRLELRTEGAVSTTRLLLLPAPASLTTADGAAVQHSPDGVFAAFTAAVPAPAVLPAAVHLKQAAGPPRTVQHQGGKASGKAQEPTAAEWAAAAVYTVQHFVPAGLTNASELLLAFDYAGDAARVYYKDRLLTDNWFSGYRGDGQLEVGISYLAGENTGLLDPDAELTVLILPLKESTLGKDVWLQPRLYPTFDSAGIACTLTRVQARIVQHTALKIP